MYVTSVTFSTLLAIILVSYALPVRGIYDYVLGLSALWRLHEKIFGSAHKTNAFRTTGLVLAGADSLNQSIPGPPFIGSRIGGAVHPCPPPPVAPRRRATSDSNSGQGGGRSLLRYIPHFATLDTTVNTYSTPGTGQSTQPTGHGG